MSIEPFSRFALCDSAGMVIAIAPRCTDFTCNWSPDRELIVLKQKHKVGDYIDIEHGEEWLGDEMCHCDHTYIAS